VNCQPICSEYLFRAERGQNGFCPCLIFKEKNKTKRKKILTQSRFSDFFIISLTAQILESRNYAKFHKNLLHDHGNMVSQNSVNVYKQNVCHVAMLPSNAWKSYQLLLEHDSLNKFNDLFMVKLTKTSQKAEIVVLRRGNAFAFLLKRTSFQFKALRRNIVHLEKLKSRWSFVTDPC